MEIKTVFAELVNNIKVPKHDKDTIMQRYQAITNRLNNEFYEINSEVTNNLIVGSFGRRTAIKGVSDLDMLYIMPDKLRGSYAGDKGQECLLQDTKQALLKLYPKTDIKVSRCVNTIQYSDGTQIEVQPVFKKDDGSFLYPDTYEGGKWKPTKPKEEQKEVTKYNIKTDKTFQVMCRIMRTWNNEKGVGIGGLLLDTLIYNFFIKNEIDCKVQYSDYLNFTTDFFNFLKNEREQDYYHALGSNQHVKVKNKFQTEAKRAYNSCTEVQEKLAGNKNQDAYDILKELYGRYFPITAKNLKFFKNNRLYEAKDTEEFIEDKYRVNVKYKIKLTCDVIEKEGLKEKTPLEHLLKFRYPLKAKRTLEFTLTNISVPEPFEVRWKVLNRGNEAIKRNKIRGEIEKGNDNNPQRKTETSDFKGDHIVECYAIIQGAVVARAKILVPISENA